MQTQFSLNLLTKFTIYIGFVLPVSICHVRLTFPETRWPPLDFLDAFRTQAPCGIPRTNGGKITYMASGQAYNVTWHQGYPHEGGYRITLLDKRGHKLVQLTEGKFTGAETPLIEHRGIILPSGSVCDHCILQLEREASEYGVDGYMFHSCADIAIVPQSSKDNIQMTCSGHGTLASGQCSCDRLYHGDLCQYKSKEGQFNRPTDQYDCVDASDCSNNGQCVHRDISTYPRNICYCSQYYFGKNCDKNFIPEEKEQYCFNYNYPSPKNPGIKSDVENIMLTYGLFNKNCYTKRSLSLADQVDLYWRIYGNDIEFILDFPGQSWVSLGWRPEGLTEECQAYPFGKVETVPIESTEEEPTGESVLPEFPDLESDKLRQPRAQYDSSEPEPAARPNEHIYLDDAGRQKGPNHPMDCMDVVIASVQNNALHIGDYYSRDRSTPLLDSVYGHKNSIQAGFGAEINGRTIVMFRKPIMANEPTDHGLTGQVTVGWAYGQDWSQEERDTDPLKKFYARDELKYHGRRNRGTTRIEFLPIMSPVKAGQLRSASRCSTDSFCFAYCIAMALVTVIVSVTIS